MKAYGPYVAARTLRQGQVSVLRGVDRLTGMPVLLYLLPDDDAPARLTGPRLLTVSDSGIQDGETYAAVVLPPAAAPARDVTAAARGALQALADLHERHLVHGGLMPDQLWSAGDEVWVAGAGLPWGELGGGFDAPEGAKSAAADLYALGRTLEALGDLPVELQHLLDDAPERRGTAKAALATLQGSPEDVPVPVGAVASTPSGAITATEAHRGTVSIPTAQDSTDRPIKGDQLSGQSAAPLLLDESFDGPHPDPVFEKSAGRMEVPRASPRNQPIRIGWEEDDSWRVVKALPEPAIRPRQSPRRWLVVAGVAVVIVLALLGAALWPRAGAGCCVVQFDVRGASDVQGELEILDAPAESGLERGARLSPVPGRVEFPDAPGVYTVRLLADGYQPQTLRLRVPTAQPVVLEVAR